ncbi:S41 family peptidase [Candidatus Bipolaricaulota sp. J31]
MRRAFLALILVSFIAIAAPKESSLFAPLEELYELIRYYYYRVEDVSEQDLLYGAMKGMVEALGDPYSVFFTPDEYKKWQDAVEGEYTGVGMEITIRKGKVVVVTPFPGTPAYEAGIRPGDWIKAVDGTPTEGLSLEEVSMMIRGPEGTEVTLTIVTPAGEEREVTLVRARIVIQPVLSEYWEDKGIGYIRIILFTARTPAEVGKALYHLPLDRMKGLILDLRNNPGGLLSAAVDVASFFVDEGVILYARGPLYGFRPYYSRGNAFPNLPLAVLVNEGTASGAEIVAGAIRDHGVGVLVGRKTFGKGVIQQIVREFPDGSALKLTIGEYLTPDKHRVHEVGIEPDIAVEYDPDAEEDPDIAAAIQWILSHAKEPTTATQTAP